jgi:methylthioribose-1-phosphate isomerase
MIKPGKITSVDTIKAIKWDTGGLILLDQRRLPHQESYLTIDSVVGVVEAIRNMTVRGAPAIGITAAYGFVMALAEALKQRLDWRENLSEKVGLLRKSRPTAVNLEWALNRMQLRLDGLAEPSVSILLEQARAIHQEDINGNLAMGEYGANFLKNCDAVLTHCNTGSLATGGFGTALGVIRTAWANQQINNVYISETRPWLQGSRLSAWELEQDKIPATLITDSAAAHLMNTGKIKWVITGADRVAANGDVANKIGTYSLAVNAHHHGLGFMVVAPFSTIDAQTPDGNQIQIEERSAEELVQVNGQQIAPLSVKTFNPVFDITPANLITVLVTELGIIESPNQAKIRQFLRRKIP